MTVTQASLMVEIDRIIEGEDAGSWIINAPWLKEVLIGPEWEPLYLSAMRSRPGDR